MRIREIISEGSESNTVVRIDSKFIKDFSTDLKNYKHNADWSQSGLDTGDDSYWQKNNITPEVSKGIFAGDPHRTALYATGNAHETRYIEFVQNGQPVVYFDQRDLPKMRNHKSYLTVFDAANFRRLPSGEYFSENPGAPIKRATITDPFQYISSQGWEIRFTKDLNQVLQQAKDLHQAGKIDHYGAEGMNETAGAKLAENFADGRNPQDRGDSRRHGIPKKASLSTLDKITHSKTASPRKKQLAHWQANMRRGRAKKK